jgi:hypothetical protein
MNLGIVVIYQVREGNEPLLDLHLRMIDRHTHVPFTIYGSANKLTAPLRSKLESHPRVTICDIPTTDLNGSLEHSYYLDRQVKSAIDAGASHIVTLHVDSFPIRSDWIEVLAGTLSPSCVLAGVVLDKATDYKPNTSCLFFAREFYLEHRPTFRLSDAERATGTYERYRRRFPHKWDSGVGYGYKAFEAGLTWHPLMRSTKGPDLFGIANTYGDLIFHLGGAIRFTEPQSQKREPAPRRTRIVNTIRRHGVGALLKRAAMRAMPRRMGEKIDPEYYETPQRVFARSTSALFANPDAFLERLRHQDHQ